MAVINVDPAAVRPVRFNNTNLDTRPAGAAMQRGTVVVDNPAAGADNGKWIPGNGGGARKPALLIRRAAAKNYECTALRGDALVELGDPAQSLAIGAAVFATPTGGLDDSANAGANFRIGEMVAGYSVEKSTQGAAGAPRRLLRLDA